ncbi:murein biosynthesis integral membrane protein MurJ [Pseudomonas protegens]|jgi:murein biosynthesis integral membrane protein MurJ|uniref:Lipid II flippase MurJ n=3 Tax=Pseudomonas TaxID=286 RepID=A0AAU7WSB9_9PSED|nr:MULTISPECIES: lipid II flippase MurJ [Pseudomonas]GED74555.1 membrane protein [Pseudomonas fluorescens]AQT11156.1 membrane protein PslK [Pseudomonas protegens]MBF0642356.1 murein biosynthesis integral membrane protein MurJ [Pseudomonas protegens]MBP5099439.1 murein biosynthesis integral membrane protein MurJ [Pseudomonas protegens]MBP5101198.1 murein biosynthesis integral membrane protein MurJ [Pseudomonas protegens]
MFGATLWLTLATLTGLAAGFAREWLLVAAWGAGGQSDGFLVAMFLPEALRMALAAGLLSAAALPLYQQRSAGEQQAWLSALAPRLLLCGLLLALLLSLGAPLWVRLIGPGLGSDGYALASGGLHWLAWCAPGFILHGLFCVPLQARARFVLAGLGSLLFNLPPVIYLASLHHAATPTGLAAACVLGSLLMPTVLLPSLLRDGWRPWRMQAAPGAGRELLQRIGPLLSSNLASQGLALLERMAASLLGEGAVTWINLARKLINLPLIALMSLNQVLLGLMSGSSGEQRLDLLRKGLSSATLLTIPAVVGLIGAAAALVHLLLPNQAADSPLPELLAWFSVPLMFGAWNALLARYAYAAGDTRMPLNCELAGSLLNALLLAALPYFLGLIGIALAAICGVILTGLLLMRRQQLLGLVPWRSHWLIGLGGMALAALFLHPLTSIWWQLGLSSACGLLLLLILAAWLRPWRQNLT